ncbi:MAG: ROK family protein [Sphaerobacteraceae bacterium]|nr:MAG: ROK family protein [Sphaerobacteraceae bacterium]
MADVAFAVDLGGTNIRGGIVDQTGEIRHHRSVRTAVRGGVYAIIDQIVKLADEVFEEFGSRDIAGIGVVAPGPLEPKAGIVRFAPNLPGWENVPLTRLLEERLQMPVVLGNDGNCAALGESMFGAGKNVDNLIYLALGTGLGAGIIHQGHLIEGIAGLGGEVGHISIDSNGSRCTCGGIGCMEAYIGGWAIARHGEMAVHSERSTLIREIAGEERISAEIVAKAAKQGDPAAIDIFARAGRALAVGIGGLVNVFNPELIVVGGGLARAGDLIMEPFRSGLAHYTMVPIHRHVAIVPSALETHTGVYGAAANVFYQRPDQLTSI